MTRETAHLESSLFSTKFLNELRNDVESRDVVLWAENKSISVHRIILTASSSYFKQVLNQMKEGNKSMAYLFTDIKFEHLSYLVDYLYSGKVHISGDKMPEFLNLANKFKITGLYEDSSPNIIYEIDSNDEEEKNLPEIVGETRTRLKAIEHQHNSTNGENVSLANTLNNKTLLDAGPSCSKSLFRVPVNNCPGKRTSREIEHNNYSQSSNFVVANGNRSSSSSAYQYSTHSEMFTGFDDTIPNDSPSVGSGDGNNGPFICSAEGCDAQFSSIQERTRHQNYKCGKTPEFICKKCDRSFFLRNTLINHRRKCPNCDSEYSNNP